MAERGGESKRIKGDNKCKWIVNTQIHTHTLIAICINFSLVGRKHERIVGGLAYTFTNTHTFEIWNATRLLRRKEMKGCCCLLASYSHIWMMMVFEYRF